MLSSRIRSVVSAGLIHLIISAVIALVIGLSVLELWYPYPYRELAGGWDLFFLVLAVDVICGPLLTIVIYNPTKPRKELAWDLTLVVLIQGVALGYGIWSIWVARPLFLVQEVDRFKVIAAPDLEPVAIPELARALQPSWWRGPIVVAIREPKDAKERSAVTFESVQGGRDYAERPDFYLPYEGDAARKSLLRARPLAEFIQKQPSQALLVAKFVTGKSIEVNNLVYLPIIGREDWIAVLDNQGKIQGFLKGDGF